MTQHVAQGPYFDELTVGQRFDSAPALTLTDGHAALHQAITGGRLRLSLDAGLAAAVTGGPSPVHPGLVWDVAIGQSSVLTQHVIANLCYRGLAFHRYPVLGDTLRTTVEVAGLRQTRSRPAGLATLHLRTVDQHARPVLDFWRCAMLPLRDPDARTGHADDLDQLGHAPPVASPAAGWRWDRYRDLVPGPHLADLRPGDTWLVDGGDVVSAAPELARLTLNVAAVHHDAARSADGRRLVFGGHTIGLACAQLSRALPGIVTVAGWRSCDHLGPVHEGDTLHSTIEVEGVHPWPGGGGLAHLRSRVRTAAGTTPGADAGAGAVLDWRLTAVLA